MNKEHEEKKPGQHDAPGQKKQDGAHSHEGKVVSMIGDKLTSTCADGKSHSHTLAKDAKVTCDGHASKAADLKAGHKIRVTTKKDDKSIVTCVEALDKHTEFAHCG